MKEFVDKSRIHSSLLKDKPLVFRGAASHWPALKKWTDSYLTQTLQDGKAPNLFVFDKNYQQRRRVIGQTAKSGFEQVLHGDPSQKAYLIRQPLRHQEAKLLKDVQVPSWIKNKKIFSS